MSLIPSSPPNMVAGAIGFTWTWNPLAGQPNNIPSLTGLICTMKVVNTTVSPPYKASFSMTVSEDGMSASYTTVAASDFPKPGNYEFQFTASNSAGTIVIPTVIVTQLIAASL